ncbi:hypothetical protein INP77_07655 [Methylophilus sp. 13]|uniref:hypothetical protein n=1 Tax=Methylophilus sp. 13 TaxID=2781018 RepID=UPI00188EAFF3|nr:hypothetical protein [Methylophilus sp. 13]MBF5039363.1 hypothetical protein [Methylophilus sp. 13]
MNKNRSKNQKNMTQEESNRLAGGGLGGAILGASLGGPTGAIIGGVVGLLLAENENKNKRPKGK